jgi:hypothetical protein
MATKYADFMSELKREAKAEGPEAVVELDDFKARFRLARRFVAEQRRRRSRGGRRGGARATGTRHSPA